MNEINALHQKIKKKILKTSDLDLFLINFEQEKPIFSDLIFIEESIKWIKALSYLLGLFEENIFSFSSDKWKIKDVEFAKLYRTINEMDDAGLFQFMTWAMGGSCSMKVIDLLDYRNFVYDKINLRLDAVLSEYGGNEIRRASREDQPKKILFYQRGHVPPDPTFPYVEIAKDNWDDFGYKTSFNLLYYIGQFQKIDLGFMKILHKTSTTTNIPNKFTKLGREYCSLAPSQKYYERLFDLGKIHYDNILEGLNDIVYKPEIINDFRNIEGFQTSLLRGSEAEKTFLEARNYFLELPEFRQEKFIFTFSSQLDGAKAPHKISFDFSYNEFRPFNIMALIGENGTGKTEILSRLAQSLSGLKPIGQFEPERPLFSKIILVSYSPFDRFIKDEDLKVSYSYFGLKNEKNEIDFEKALTDFTKSLHYLRENNLTESWRDTLSIIIDEDIVRRILKTLIQKGNIITLSNYGLSSGQKILLVILTNIMATINRDSLVLFDEPETFLHPSLVSKLMNALYKLMKRFNSYSIISTHSPIVLQEIPSSSVRVLERIGNIPVTRNLSIECFGENLSTITQEVFGIESTNVNYQKYFDVMLNKLDYEGILRVFDNKLSFNARMYLKSKMDNSD